MKTELQTHSEILGRISMIVGPYAPDGVCETEEIVRHVCRLAEAMPLVKSELERIRTEKLATRGLTEEANAISWARWSINRAYGNNYEQSNERYEWTVKPSDSDLLKNPRKIQK